MSPDTVVQVDIGTIFAVIGGVMTFLVIAPIVWILKSALADLRSMKDAHTNFKDEVNREFVRKTDYVMELREIKDMLRSIFDKLDGKADK